MESVQRFKKACSGRAVDRPPVWLMRQAGRTLPEYRELRKSHSFWDICRSPELATRVTLMPLKRFPVDAAVIFSDILVIPSAMGMDVAFSPSLALAPVIRSSDGVNRLKPVDVYKRLGYVADTISLVREETQHSKAVLGFCGAPFTLASYMVEGGGSKHFDRLKALMHGQPALFSQLLERLTDVCADFLIMQAEAGATALQIFDTWARELSPEAFRRFVSPHVSRLCEVVRPYDVPLIYYANGIGHLVDEVNRSGVDVIGVDWRTPLSNVCDNLGKARAVQGNLDPGVLFSDAETIRERVFEMLDATRGIGHIVNLGHGLIPHTPVEGIETFVHAVSAWAEVHSPALTA